MNSYPEYWPRKNSTRIGPSTPRKLGSLKGVTRLIRNIDSGSALSLSITPPPSSGPHLKLCFP